jgi:hypothetical protein
VRRLSERNLSLSQNSTPRAPAAIKRASAVVSDKVAEDRLLVDRCVAGEVAAWSSLYSHSHDSLLAGIRAFLGRGGQDANLIDEIAARVWYALVKDNFELLDKFDVRHGCR